MKHFSVLVVALLLCSRQVAGQVAVELRALPAASAGDTVTTLPTSQATFNAGETVFVEMWAQTTVSTGLAQVTADISFDAVALDATTLTHTALFSLFPSGTIDNVAGLIDDAGGSHFSPGCLDQTGFTPNWVRVATLQMTAVAGGVTTVQAADSASVLFTVAICNPTGTPTVTYGGVTFTIFSNCGNGIIDPGETCDDGNTLNGDCCSAVCLLDPFLTPCDADGDSCTEDICLGGMTPTCVPTGGNVSCPPAGVCTGGGDFAGFTGCFSLNCTTCPNCFPVPGGPNPIPPAPPGDTGAEPRDSSRADVREAAVRVVAVRSRTQADTAKSLPSSRRLFALGAPIFIEIWASRVSAASIDASGLASVYVDLIYDSTTLTADEVMPGELFTTFARGALESRGRISTVGGCASLGDGTLGVDPPWVRVATVKMHAIDRGIAVVTIGNAETPFGLSVFGQLGNLPASTIESRAIAFDLIDRLPGDLGTQ